LAAVFFGASFFAWDLAATMLRVWGVCVERWQRSLRKWSGKSWSHLHAVASRRLPRNVARAGIAMYMCTTHLACTACNEQRVARRRKSFDPSARRAWKDVCFFLTVGASWTAQRRGVYKRVTNVQCDCRGAEAPKHHSLSRCIHASARIGVQRAIGWRRTSSRADNRERLLELPKRRPAIGART
jgi:hypothetical protein